MESTTQQETFTEQQKGRPFSMAAVAQVAAIEDSGIEVPLVWPDKTPVISEDGSGEQVVIIVAGKNSNRQKEIEAIHGRRKIKPKDITTENMRNDEIEKLAYCTLGWSGIKEECTRQSAARLYRTAAFFVNQLEEARDDAANFTQKGSTAR